MMVAVDFNQASSGPSLQEPLTGMRHSCGTLTTATASSDSTSYDDPLGRRLHHEATRLRAAAASAWEAAGGLLDAAVLE